MNSGRCLRAGRSQHRLLVGMPETPYWGKFLRRRTSRRRVLAAGAGVIVAAPAVLACGTSGNRGSSASTPVPRRGGILRFGTSLPLSYGLDPQIEIGSGLEIFPRVYGYLLHIDPRDDSLITDHATSIEQPDETTTIVHLDPNVRFQDIAPVNARAVDAQDTARSIERYRDNPLVLNKTWHTKVLDRIEATDPAMLRITTRSPNVYSLSEIGGISGGAIIPRELIDGAVDLSTSGIGSGPFQIDSVARNGASRISATLLTFASPSPTSTQSSGRCSMTTTAAWLPSTGAAVDIAPNRDGSEAQRLASKTADISVLSQPSLAYLSLGLRVDWPPFSDPRVREAIDIGLDRSALIRDIALGEGQVLGPVNPHIASGFWSLPDEEVTAAQGGGTPVAQRLATARAMLDQAGAGSSRILLQVAKVPQTARRRFCRPCAVTNVGA